MKNLFITLALTMLCSITTYAQDDNNHHHGRRQHYVIPTDAPILTTTTDGTTIINTSALCTEVRGYRDLTPVQIYIKKSKVQKIEALRNNEGPRYMTSASTLLDRWNGKRVKEAVKVKVDAVTGATYTSNALIQNVQQGLKYYLEKK